VCTTKLIQRVYPLKTEFLLSTIYKNSVRTSRETCYISGTKPNRVLGYKKAIAIYCVNHTEHKYILWAECKVLVG
jgi:hypothetical protein